MIGFSPLSEQRLAKYPIMPLAVFTNWSNNATFIVVFMHGMVLIGIEYLSAAILSERTASLASPERCLFYYYH